MDQTEEQAARWLEALGEALIRAEGHINYVRERPEAGRMSTDELELAISARDDLLEQYRAAIEDQGDGGILVVIPFNGSTQSAIWGRIGREPLESRRVALREYVRAESALDYARHERDRAEERVTAAEHGYAQYFYFNAGLSSEVMRAKIELIRDAGRELGMRQQAVDAAFTAREDLRIGYAIHLHYAR